MSESNATGSKSEQANYFGVDEKGKKHQSNSLSHRTLPSFFKWFRKSSGKVKNLQISATRSSIEPRNSILNQHFTGRFNSSETLSRSSSPTLGYFSPSSSCDSVRSTSTSSTFAYIQPTHYNRTNGVTTARERFLNQATATDETYRQRLRQQSNLREIDKRLEFTLRRKYKLYCTETRISTDNVCDGEYSGGTLPELRHQNIQRPRYRRAVSDCSKDKKAGAYVHVKGKRKAPSPPTPIQPSNIVDNISINASQTDNSTLTRKKRRAPQPPILSNSAQEIEGEKELTPDEAQNNSKSDSPQNCQMQRTKELTEQQKQFLIDSVVRSQGSSSSVQMGGTKPETPSNDAPVSPRPWYKRPLTSNRESSIPFKREIVLKTMEKRKNKNKDYNQKISDQLPEVGFSRSSIFDAKNKLIFFMRSKDHTEDLLKAKDKEKRRSGITIPSISELDREAAEIVNNKHMNRTSQQKDGDDKYFRPQEHLILQQQMFESNLNNNTVEHTSSFDKPGFAEPGNEEEEIPTPASAKDLISKFENSSNNLPKITLNPSFIENSELEMKNQKLKEEKFEDESLSPTITKLSWNCPFCTLENPNWRIICEICERIKPYDKKLTQKVLLNVQKRSSGQGETPVDRFEPGTNWDQKAEKVRQFMSSNSHTGDSENVPAQPASKISVENFQNKFTEKSSSPPIANPPVTEIETFRGEREKNPLLDSSAIVTTIQPVFYAETILKSPNIVGEIVKDSTTVNSNSVNVAQIRTARLAKFDPDKSLENLNEKSSSPEYDLLEREKKRLRDMIQAMNSKALLEKYPINHTVDEEATPAATEVEPPVKESGPTNQGAIKKVFVNSQCPDLPNPSQPKKIQRKKIRRSEESETTPRKISSASQTASVKRHEISTKIEMGDAENEFYANLAIPIYENSPLESDSLLYTNQEYVQVSGSDSANVKQKLETVGISDCEAHFENSCKISSRTDSLALGKIMRNLEQAILAGDDESAAKIAKDLAKMKISLHVTKQKQRKRPISVGESELSRNIIVPVFVEDKFSENGPNIHVTVTPFMTVLQLKYKVLKDFEIPISIQRWLINDELAENDKTLLELGVRSSSSTFYLYLVSTDESKNQNSYELNKFLKGPTKAFPEDFELEPESDESSDCQNDNEIAGAVAISVETAASEIEDPNFLESNKPQIKTTRWECNHCKGKNQTDNEECEVCGKKTSGIHSMNMWTCRFCTLINPAETPNCLACSVKKATTKIRNTIEESTFDCSTERKNVLSDNPRPRQAQLLRSPEKKNDLNRTNPNRKSSEAFNIAVDNSSSEAKKDLPAGIEPKTQVLPKSCSPNISKISYRGVDNFNPNRKVIVELSASHKNKKGQAPHPPTEKLTLLNDQISHYTELLNLDSADIVPNIETLDCPICFLTVNAGEGCVLRDCLHSFCKNCLCNTVQYNEEAEIKCPFMDAEYSCDSFIQDREIKALVSKDLYEIHLSKSIRVAEHRIENAFHCKTPNCRGWCIYEDEDPDTVNQFKCPVCKINNCLTCRVVHDGLTCKQYQDRLNSDCDSNLAAKRTKDMLKEMVEKGEAMNCPTCQVIMMKKWGCDWLKCSMCKTEVCWVTRGPRWGPAGKGDTSGGCKCGVNGVKCHPKCSYCH